ncbi:hypothetical protein [Priestia megaterium]|uniref:hypothetical protein n=1 Tax=Priestia megaterium TaxID=1404 RepID=UPI002812F9C5|nr:hypothetical protein [Priestia megaterium]MDR0128706.1 hypothetical protein [Priestia megaterium]
MNHYQWKATSGNVGDVYALDEEEAKAKVEALFDLVVSRIKLLKENVSREEIKKHP